jgi:hypothetical protein
MHQVQLNDQLYREAQRRASEAGYATVDDYVADVVSHDLVEDDGQDTPDLDHLFTPPVVAELEQIAARAKAGGKTYTSEEVREHFRAKSDAWRENRSG